MQPQIRFFLRDVRSEVFEVQTNWKHKVVRNSEFRSNCIPWKCLKIMNLKFSWNFDDFRFFDFNGSRRRELLKISFRMLWTALRVPGGNQVDGLPPARHTEPQCFEKARPREDLWCWTWIFWVKWYFAFKLLVLLH